LDDNFHISDSSSPPFGKHLHTNQFFVYVIASPSALDTLIAFFVSPCPVAGFAALIAIDVGFPVEAESLFAHLGIIPQINTSISSSGFLFRPACPLVTIPWDSNATQYH